MSSKQPLNPFLLPKSISSNVKKTGLNDYKRASNDCSLVLPKLKLVKSDSVSYIADGELTPENVLEKPVVETSPKTRKKYTDEDNDFLIESFLKIHGPIRKGMSITGNALWHDIHTHCQRKKMLLGRSYMSMRTHFLKYLLPGLMEEMKSKEQRMMSKLTNEKEFANKKNEQKSAQAEFELEKRKKAAVDCENETKKRNQKKREIAMNFLTKVFPGKNEGEIDEEHVIFRNLELLYDHANLLVSIDEEN